VPPSAAPAGEPDGRAESYLQTFALCLTRRGLKAEGVLHNLRQQAVHRASHAPLKIFLDAECGPPLAQGIFMDSVAQPNVQPPLLHQTKTGCVREGVTELDQPVIVIVFHPGQVVLKECQFLRRTIPLAENFPAIPILKGMLFRI